MKAPGSCRGLLLVAIQGVICLARSVAEGLIEPIERTVIDGEHGLEARSLDTVGSCYREERDAVKALLP